MTDDQMQRLFSEGLNEAAHTVWERFRTTMPDRYFKETDPETQLSHLHVLTACQASGVQQDLVMQSPDGNTWTFLTNRSRPGQLGRMLDRLPNDRSLSSARAYTSNDGEWVLDIFELGEPHSPTLTRESFEEHSKRLSTGLNEAEKGSLKEYLKGCSAEYLKAVPQRIGQIHFRLVSQVVASGNVAVEWENIDPQLDTVRIAVEGTEAKFYFQRLAHYLGRRGIDIERAYVTSFRIQGRPFRYLGFTVRGAEQNYQERLSADLKRLYFLDTRAVEIQSRFCSWSLLDCELTDFFLTLAHSILAFKDPIRFARERLLAAVDKYPVRMLELVHCLRQGEKSEEPLGTFDRAEERRFFETCQEILNSVLLHNLSNLNRRTVGVRLAPSLFRGHGEESPYAVIFARGLGFQGFHVRFQKVARGGMRLICPRSVEAHTVEQERLFAEAYNLARAQHLKNKDIPEGGSKAAVLVTPGTPAASCGQAFADTLLDLTVGTEGSDDLIYLGPDENVSNELILWIAERAALRGHPLPSAFMSSKPGAGINHKEFGITSEGVTVFLEEGLRRLGIDPDTDPFTVKITGGPDGDVAGNELRILLTRYPKTVKIVGIADGSGVAEDPDGLSGSELLSLFQSASPIAQFDRSRLGPKGRVVSVEDPQGVELRNTLHNRIKSDAFVPAGGRPETIHAGNWEEFLDRGEPSSPLIVEGANLFLTEDARRALSSHGVSIVKDSSANKCGVICSSFEVLAGMLLTQSEFLQHKEEFVAQVLERLRLLARSEAELLFREQKRRPDLSLPELSIRLSKVMLRTAEAVAADSGDPLEDRSEDTRELFENYLPPLLRRMAADRYHQVPLDYRQRIVACALSGKIVYREGITYLEDLPQEALQELALTYLKGERVVRALINEVKDSNIPSADKLAELLERGGARTLAEH